MQIEQILTGWHYCTLKWFNLELLDILTYLRRDSNEQGLCYILCKRWLSIRKLPAGSSVLVLLWGFLTTVRQFFFKHTTHYNKNMFIRTRLKSSWENSDLGLLRVCQRSAKFLRGLLLESAKTFDHLWFEGVKTYDHLRPEGAKPSDCFWLKGGKTFDQLVPCVYLYKSAIQDWHSASRWNYWDAPVIPMALCHFCCQIASSR